MSNYLSGTRLYLSGPIEYQTDLSWREQVIHTLKFKFGINVFDPHSDPKQQWANHLKEAKTRQDWETVAKIAKSFVRKDLCMVDRADFLIAYLPRDVITTGTHHEIINAVNAKKPVLLVTNSTNIGCIPSWYFGFIPHQYMFYNWEKLYEYLELVNKESEIENSRWDFIYGKI
jgi:nucleoside 2-deoxyribosyltransferase